MAMVCTTCRCDEHKPGTGRCSEAEELVDSTEGIKGRACCGYGGKLDDAGLLSCVVGLTGHMATLASACQCPELFAWTLALPLPGTT
jgi:hypothetical protein